MGAQLFSRWSGESKSSLGRNWTETKAVKTNINLTLEVVFSFKTHTGGGGKTLFNSWNPTLSARAEINNLSYTSLPALLSEMMYNLQFGQIYYRQKKCLETYTYHIYILRAGSPFQSLVVLRMTKSTSLQCYVQVSLSFNSMATLLL